VRFFVSTKGHRNFTPQPNLWQRYLRT